LITALTDDEKIADALRAGPEFIRKDATILDWAATSGANIVFCTRVQANGVASLLFHRIHMTSPDVSTEFS